MLVLALAWLAFLYMLNRRPAPERRQWRLLGGALLVTALATFAIFTFPLRGFVNAFPIDDSYITLTAVRNLVEHGQFAINPQYPLAGITSPLHVALVALFALAMPLEIASRVVGLVSLAALALGVLWWAREMGASPRVAAATAAITVVCGPMGFGALNGLETVPFTALLIWSFWAYEVSWRRPGVWFAVGALVGLTILTRPEGWFLAIALYVATAIRLWCERPLREWRRVKFALASLLVTAAVLAPYLLANLHYYGEFFPSTVSAKKYFFSDFCRPLIQRVALGVSVSWLSIGPYVVLVPLLYWARPYLRRVYPWLFVLLFYGAYITQFVGALSHYWGRYQHPLLPVLLLGLVWGVEGVYRALARENDALGKTAAVVLPLFLFFAAGIGGQLEKDIYRNALVNSQSFLMAITDFIKNNTAPGETVATHDVGALYYFGERPVLDLVGLADPEVAKLYRKKPNGCRAPGQRKARLYALVKHRQPALVYFSPKWDRWFLGLVSVDRGRHLQKVWQYTHDYQLDDRSDVKVYEYAFYKGDWSRDLTQPEP